MADDKSSGGWGSGFIVLAFAAVSALYVAHQKPPLVSTRPSNIESQLDDLRGLRQDIDARLWQDPFGAVERGIASKRKSDQPGNSGGHALQGFGCPKDTLVLGVTLPGAPYPEVAETRRRLRYAVLSALHVAGYAPADEKHIGDWQPTNPAPQAPTAQDQAKDGEDRPPTTEVGDRITDFDASRCLAPRAVAEGAQKAGNAAEGSPPLPAFVPWEEFDRGPHDHVLVLWLDEDFLAAARKPIRGLVELRKQLGKFAESEFALLGPEDSTMLAAMVNEAGHQDRSSAPLDFKVPVYNFGATAEERLFLQPIGLSGSNIADQLKLAGITHYYRTVNTDDELAKSLACELMRRHPNLDLPTGQCKTLAVPAGRGPRDHIVLISDWDTVYGDDLSKSVKEAFSDKEAGSTPGSNRVIQRSYLRGLDGQRPDRKYSQPPKTAESSTEQKPDDEASQNEEPAVATPETISRFEGAEGQSQYDYLLRLADELKERDAEFRRTDGGHIAAIGVLGSDVYDKLLILQALRPEFPEALFFTTDLDACCCRKTRPAIRVA
jgi:hypothetical protein